MDCGVITIINIGLYLINQQVLHVVVGYVKENDTIDESLKRKLDLKFIRSLTATTLAIRLWFD